MAAAAIIIFGGATIVNAANQIFLFSGTQGSISTTLTNPYDGATVNINGTYNVNNSTYNGQGLNNTLIMTNNADFITLDSSGTQTLSDVQQIVTGNGNDIIDLANTHAFSEGDCTIFTGTGNCLVWGSAANEIFNHNNVGHDIFDGGPGIDTVDFNFAKSSYTITPTGPDAFTITNPTTGTVDDVSEIEFAQFTDQTISLVPEPSALCLMVVAVARLGMRRKWRSR